MSWHSAEKDAGEARMFLASDVRDDLAEVHPDMGLGERNRIAWDTVDAVMPRVTPPGKDAGPPSVRWPHGAIADHPTYDYYVCADCGQNINMPGCPAKMAGRSRPVFDSLLADPTQQLDPDGLVARSVFPPC